MSSTALGPESSGFGCWAEGILCVDVYGRAVVAEATGSGGGSRPGDRRPSATLRQLYELRLRMAVGAQSVVIVGGGIAGGALAYGLATAGLEVTVLERTTAFADRVRGEVLQAWGVADAQRLGVERVLLDAGGRHASWWHRYNRWADEPVKVPMNAMVPEVAGSLSIGHPVACQALLEAAASVGATVVRGIEGVEVTAGSSPVVAWQVQGQAFTATPDLVIGADGRSSTVRKQVGIEREHQDGVSCISGLLVDGLDAIPHDFEATVNDHDLYMLMFHQTPSRARVYLCTGLSERRRFTGHEGPQRFLDACAGLAFPWAEELAAGRPAGPCGTVVGDDAWAPTPFVEGVVLVGDAAGFGDPLVGQGLAMTLRDARIVRDLILDGATTRSAFVSYADERLGRVERYGLIADVLAVANAEQCTNRTARQQKLNELMVSADSSVGQLVLGAFRGPETIPDDALDASLPDQIRTAS